MNNPFSFKRSSSHLVYGGFNFGLLRVIGLICVVISLVLVGFIMYMNSKYSNTTRTFSTYGILTSSWDQYKKKFINQDGRVIDFSQDSITTSEGQSYALLRAVWIDDKPTFDLVWKWTHETLKRPNDNLYGWRWGKRKDSTYGFIENGGDNSATDADSDIALALILASKRWGNQQYMDEAKKILDDVWKNETDTANGNRYITAGNWASSSDQIVTNPSYFSPYAYKVFAKVDTAHDWNSLVVPGYKLLTDASTNPLDKGKSIGLAPDWIGISKKTGNIQVVSIQNLTTNYSYDAMRVPFRVGLDYLWNNEQLAYDYLGNYQTIAQEYKNNGKLASGYSHDGTALNDKENPTLYATLLGYAVVRDKDLAKRIYEEKIIRLYSNVEDTFDENLPYYEQNWLWFGAAMYNNALSEF